MVCFFGKGRGLSERLVRRVDSWGVSGRLEGLVGSGGSGLLWGRSVGGEGGEDGGERGVVVHFSGCWKWWLGDSGEDRIARRGE